MTRGRELAELAAGYDSGGGFGFRNRIINPAMVIDQRNAGASVTINNNSAWVFSVDRFSAIGQPTDGVFTVQQSSVAPAGFTNSLLATVTTADASIGSTQFYMMRQTIEGFNTADFGWGAAGAATVTLSFWVRSSLTGTFGGWIRNSAANRSYPFSYTISAANTWEQKTITIPGDTTGTWVGATNGIGVEVGWSLGAGSSRVTTANAWAAGTFDGVTGQTNLISTNGATFYITGVQLEKGSTATSFDYRPYGTELQLCQRYFEKTFNIGTAPADGVQSMDRKQGVAFSSIDVGYYGIFKVQKRANPTMVLYKGANAGTNGQWSYFNGTVWTTMTAIPALREFDFQIDFIATGRTFGQALILDGHWTASAEL